MLNKVVVAVLLMMLDEGAPLALSKTPRVPPLQLDLVPVRDSTVTPTASLARAVLHLVEPLEVHLLLAVAPVRPTSTDTIRGVPVMRKDYALIASAVRKKVLISWRMLGSLNDTLLKELDEEMYICNLM